MKKIIQFLFLTLIISSCKKSSIETTIPPGNPNNQVNANVSVKGGAFAPLAAAGNNTLFSKRTDPNGDVVIVCLGSGSQGQVKVTLVNISSAGVYTMGGGGLAGSQYIIGSFEIGNPLTGPYEFFRTPAPPPILGTINLDELTSNSIRGSFTMTCTGSTGTIQITNGTFKGSF
jgi:hypothetical protein